MLKRKIDDYIRNYYETTRNALLVTGARQTGKTYSIRQFGKSFKSFVEINFIEMPEAVELFKGAKSSGDMLLRLSALTSVPLIKGETLVFFDEVQESSRDRYGDQVPRGRRVVPLYPQRLAVGGGVEGPAFGTSRIYGG